MTVSGRKLRANKPRSNTVRVIAVKRLPSDGMPEAVLANRSPYVTDHGLAEFFEELAGILASIDNQPTATAEERERIAQKVMQYITARLSEEPPEIVVVALSRLQEALYQGVYKRTKSNPLFAIEAFVAFHHLGLYPPFWVLEWINTAFLSYMESGGEKSLDTLLGATRGRGQTKIWEEMRATSTEAKITREIAFLNRLGISVVDAAAMVAGRLEAAKIPCVDPETLAERYVKRGWSKVFKQPKSALATISPEIKKNILASYPKDTIPAKFR